MSPKSDHALMNCHVFGKGHRMPPEFSKFQEKIENFEVREDDVYLTSYPKTGSTWLQELIWLVANDLDYEEAKTLSDERFPTLEGDSLRTCHKNFCLANDIECSNILLNLDTRERDLLKKLNETRNRRFMRTHLPWDLLPNQIQNGEKTPKIIHVMRNPKQVVPSFYYHSVHLFPAYKGNLNEFVNVFIEGKLLFGEYFNTVLSYWEYRNLPNILFLTYEEMRRDLKGAIKKVSVFLEKSYSDEQLDELTHYLSFEQLKNNVAVNRQMYLVNSSVRFMREGSIDGYKKELSPEMIEKLDSWIAKYGKGTGLPYEM